MAGMSIAELRTTVAIAWNVYAHDVTITFGPREVEVTTPTRRLFIEKFADLYNGEDGMGAILAACAGKMAERAESLRGTAKWHIDMSACARKDAEHIETRLSELRALVKSAEEAE